jgi:hypothetical protein
MVAGISGATLGSGGGSELDDRDGKLIPPPHAPRKIVSADAIARLATVRALTDLIIAFPRAIPGRTRHAANRKTPAGAMTSGKITPQLRFGFQAASYIGLKKALTPLLDRNSAKPYSPGPEFSTQISRLLRVPQGGAENPAFPAISMASS